MIELSFLVCLCSAMKYVFNTSPDDFGLKRSTQHNFMHVRFWGGRYLSCISTHFRFLSGVRIWRHGTSTSCQRPPFSSCFTQCGLCRSSFRDVSSGRAWSLSMLAWIIALNLLGAVHLTDQVNKIHQPKRTWRSSLLRNFATGTCLKCKKDSTDG